jgi:hypothetical protein
MSRDIDMSLLTLALYVFGWVATCPRRIPLSHATLLTQEDVTPTLVLPYVFLEALSPSLSGQSQRKPL